MNTKAKLVRKYVASYTDRMFRIIPIRETATTYICTTTLRDKVFVVRNKHLEVYERMVDIDAKEIKNSSN